MKYLQIKKFFLFDILNDYLALLDDIEEGLDYKEVTNRVNNFLIDMTEKFVEIVFKVVYNHTIALNLNLFGESKNIGIKHIKNIYKSIVFHDLVKEILSEINEQAINLKNSKEFNIRDYEEIMILVEELDCICAFELYSYLLREDSQSVFNFIINKLFKDLRSSSRNYDLIFSQIEDKIKLFGYIYPEQSIKFISKNSEQLLYKINNNVKSIVVEL